MSILKVTRKRLNVVFKTRVLRRLRAKNRDKKQTGDLRVFLKKSRKNRFRYNRNRFNFRRYLNKFLTHLYKFFCRRIKIQYKVKIRRFNQNRFERKIKLNKLLNPLFFKIISNFFIFTKLHYLKYTNQNRYFFSN